MNLILNAPVDSVRFIGEKMGSLLKKMGVETVSQLLHHYPFRYDDFSQISAVSNLSFGDVVTVRGVITEIKLILTTKKKRLIKAKLADESGSVDLIWFNQTYLLKNIKAGDRLSVSGKVNLFSGRLAIISPAYENYSDSTAITSLHTNRLVPIYPETKGVTSKWLRSRIRFLLNQLNGIDDFLPEEIRVREGFLPLRQALEKIHFPQSESEISEARQRLTFDELFSLLLKPLRLRRKRESQRPIFRLKKEVVTQVFGTFVKKLPFRPTPDQSRAITQILSDMTEPKPMNRLLQGEVGSGKTVVAVSAILATYLSGYKSFYMAPTETLVSQHFQTLTRFLEPFAPKIGLLTSAQVQKSNQNQSRWHDFDILVGTQAIYFNVKRFSKIGLVVIDEQHKFGVEQRAKLLLAAANLKGSRPHLLTMTATPIPRTLSLTLMGDLDISRLNQLPQERRKIKTWLVPKIKRLDAYRWIKNHLERGGEQAYIICPFIEESEDETLKSVRAAKSEHHRLTRIFKPLRVSLLHGRMSSQEKEKVMNDFLNHQSDILVATPVVEVGIDNPQASIILIEGSERFGLASIHQLRGRVGRGRHQSYCLLFTAEESPPILSRLKILEKNDNGLKIAELDLKNRGAGNVFGRQQSGFFRTKLADLSDYPLVANAARITREILERKNDKMEEWVQSLRKQDPVLHFD